MMVVRVLLCSLGELGTSAQEPALHLLQVLVREALRSTVALQSRTTTPAVQGGGAGVGPTAGEYPPCRDKTAAGEHAVGKVSCVNIRGQPTQENTVS